MKIINVLYLLVLSLCIFRLTKMSKSVVKIGQFKGTCDGFPQNLSRFTNVKLTNTGGIYHISLKLLSFKKEDNHDIKVQVIPYRCKSEDQPDTCEKYTDVTMKHFCGILNADHKPWTPFIQAMKPPFKCPIRKGTYVLNNGTVDLREFALWPVGTMYWKSKIVIRDEVTNEFLFCTYIEGQIIR